MVDVEKKPRHQSKKFGWRHVQAILLFMGMAIAYALRFNMSIAIVAMRNKTSANPDFDEYEWDQSKSSLILGSFFWGYIIPQLPSSHIASYWSAQKFLAWGMFSSSIFNLLIPFVAKYGYMAVIYCRVAMGLSQGCLMTCSHTILSRWIPPMERARLVSLVLNATQLGTLTSMLLSGFLAASRFGWPSIFYVFGFIGVAWSILFFFLGSDHPSEHQKISSKEKDYISNSFGGSIDKIIDTEEPKVPWKAILTSAPFWATTITNCGAIWGFYTFLTQLPTFVKYILQFDISKNGGISALPYLAMWLMGFLFSYCADLAQRKGVPTIVIRKVGATIALLIPAMSLLFLCLIKSSDETTIIITLVVAVGFCSAGYCSYSLSNMDLSPRFTGPMTSIASFASNTLGIIVPYVTGIIVSDETNEDQWYTVFYITAAIYFVANIVYLIFGKATLQPWNDPNTMSKSHVESS